MESTSGRRERGQVSASVRRVPAVAQGELPTPPQRRRRGESRPAPVLNDSYAHLSIAALREYRRALGDEENKVSYWRRILQARLDLVVAGSTEQRVEHARLTPLLAGERVGVSRRAVVQVVPLDEIPPLPRLEELWERRVEPGDEQGRAAFEQDLRTAEAQLSAYRAALHAQIGGATGELIARYREDPGLCLTALPLPSQRPGA
jgi:hypothetical protein